MGRVGLLATWVVSAMGKLRWLPSILNAVCEKGGRPFVDVHQRRSSITFINNEAGARNGRRVTVFFRNA